MELSKNRKTLRVVFCSFIYILGALYLSVVVRRALGGDDRINWLYFWLGTKDKSFLECIISTAGDFFHKINPLNMARYFPMSACSAIERKIFYSTVPLYRIWILIYTVIDIALLSRLIGRLMRNNYAEYFTFVLSVVSVNFWRMGDVNPMTTYEALVQRCFLWSLLCLHCYLSWYSSKKKGWMIAGTVFLLFSCFTYEIGYMTFFYVLAIALFEKPTLVEYIKKCFPAFAGTSFAAVLYIICASHAGEASADTSVYLAPNAIFIALIKQMFSSLPIHGMIDSNVMINVSDISLLDWTLALIMGLICAVVIIRNQTYPEVSDYMNYILLGLALLVLPSLLISLTVKFQDGPYTAWGTGWIVTLIGSFGVGIMGVTIVLGILRLFSDCYESNMARYLLALFVGLVVFGTGVYSRAGTEKTMKTEYQLSYYESACHALEDGLLDEVSDGDTIVSAYYVWGNSGDALLGLFKRFADRNVFSVYFEGDVETDELEGASIFYYDNPVKEVGDGENVSCSLIGRVERSSFKMLKDIILYVDSDTYRDMTLRYKIKNAEGEKETIKIKLSEYSDVSEADYGYFIRLNGDIKLDSIKFIRG